MGINHKFRLTSYVEGDTTSISISGAIDEAAIFNEVRNDGRIKVDLSGVTRLNSVGTRAWCLWIQRFRSPVEVILINCPTIMVKNFGSIKGFLTNQCRVFSFEIPFYSPETGERQDFMATWGKNFTSNSEVKLPTIRDSKGNPMVMDVHPDTYFGFLRR